jgi:hypothetical protein
MKIVFFSMFVFIVSLIYDDVIVAQSSEKLSSGEIVGQLRDCHGDGIRKAKIIVPGGKIKRKLKSKNNGEFRITLPEGTYQITVEKYGFKRYIVQDVKVQTNLSAKINLEMEAGYASDDLNDGKQNLKPCPPSNKSVDVRAKQQPFHQRSLVSLTLRGGGFALRHLNRQGVWIREANYSCLF